MSDELKVSLIGLDTSHTVQFAMRMQAPDCQEDQKVEGMRAISCLRFPTAFQSEEGLNDRQKQLEEWGIKVTTDFDEAIDGCDAIMLEINDPAYHLEYFAKCAGLGKPVFLDKPFADTIENGRKIYDLAKEKNTRMFSASSLRFVPQLLEACNAMPEPKFVSVYGALGVAPAGSSIVWYGVHAFEMLQRAIGRGATGITTKVDDTGTISIVDYPDDRHGIVELTKGSWVYGGCLRTIENAIPYVVNMDRAYSDELVEVVKFFKGGDAPLALEDTLEVMALLDAAERSANSGKTERLGD